MVKAYCKRRKKWFTWSEIRPKNLKQLIKLEGLIKYNENTNTKSR